MSPAPDADLTQLREEIRDTAAIDDLLEQMLEVAAVVEEALAPIGVHPIVVGGLALAYWAPSGLYLTADIDVVMPYAPEAERRLEQLGFRREGRYWTLADREVFFEAPGASLMPNPGGWDEIETRSGRHVRIQRPQDVFGLRFAEFVDAGTPDVFQQLLWLLGSAELDPAELDVLVDDADYLRELGVSRRAYVEGLKILRATADHIRGGGTAPELYEIHDIAASLKNLRPGT